MTQSNGFNGGAVGYSMGPLTIGSGNVSNNGKQVVFHQIFANTFELWFWDYAVTSQCLLEVGGVGNLQNITYDGTTTTYTILGITFIVPISTFWNSNNLPYDTINGNFFGYYSTSYIDNNLYTKIDTNLLLANYQTVSGLTNILNGYETTTALSQLLTQYLTKVQIFSTAALVNYYTKKILLIIISMLK